MDRVIEPRKGDRIMVSPSYSKFIGQRGTYIGKEAGARKEDRQKYMVRLDGDPFIRVFTLCELTILK